MSTAADTIREYLARNAPVFLAAPWRHPSSVVRGLWAKQAMWAALKEMDHAAEPSAEYDEAYDLMCKAADKHREIIEGAWTNRCMERNCLHHERAA